MRIGTELLLIDWDTVMVGPPERDIWMRDDGDSQMVDGYAAAAEEIPAHDLSVTYNRSLVLIRV